MARKQTDSQVLRRSLDEPEAFTRIFDRHYDDVARFLGRRIETSEAEEVAAETFLIAFRDRARFDCDRSSARPWLFGIASNLARHHQRGEATRLRAYARVDRNTEPDLSEEAGDRADATSRRAALIGGLSALSADERDVLLLFTWAQLAYGEIAEALGIPIGTVRSRLSRARGLMPQALEHSPSDREIEGVRSHG